jgi:uncharacterized protein
MPWTDYLLAALFAMAALGCLAVVPLGLPGLWLMIAAAIAMRLAGWLSFGWPLVATCIAIGVAAEVVEAAAGATGAKMGGASRRGMVGAFVGGIAGAIFLTGLVPIPIVGTIAGGIVGSFAGAWIGEASDERKRRPDEKLRAALGAAAGKLAGTFGKVVAGVVVWVLLVYDAFTR